MLVKTDNVPRFLDAGIPSSNDSDSVDLSFPEWNHEEGAQKATEPSQICRLDLRYYPKEIENDLQGVNLPTKLIEESLACAWEYTRCVIPQYTNWNRYIAFCRIIVIGVIAEFRGGLVNVAESNHLLGYDLEELLNIVFGGAEIRNDMARELRAFLLITSHKSSGSGCGTELFHRYVNALVKSPKTWFRLRDCDALARFTIGAALACNDYNDVWFSEAELDILTELCDTMYDAASYYKHRAEGETNSTFGYVGQELRQESYRRCREILWDLDVAWVRSPAHVCVLNFMRCFGGPIHLMMRRYRYVEDNLTVGIPETDSVVAQTRENIKLWNRVDQMKSSTQDHQNGQIRDGMDRYREAVRRSDTLMFDGLATVLQTSSYGHCCSCLYRQSYGAETAGQFGGVQLCDSCKAEWRSYIESFPARASAVFPGLTQPPARTKP
ncbi:aba 3 [Trichoderma arundinaceum]|uniref:Aba 3 n=1 Tax=Trichoderma arundinaceum TaxID=490622 RepID=A0A395NWC3_TRIAR|nr:aba 3 [Trichoderma arundinaceum]